MIILSMSLGYQGRYRSMPPPIDPVPDGYEVLKDCFGEPVLDADGQKIYARLVPIIPTPPEVIEHEFLLDKLGQVIQDSIGQNIYVLKP